MTTKTEIRYRLRIALLLIALLCSACGTKQSESTSTTPLSAVLAAVPQDPINQADGFVYYVDYSAIESAYDATRPADAAAFANAREGDVPDKVWWAVWQNLFGLLQDPWFVLKTMPETVGFSALDVDQVIQFGTQPSSGLILTGSFDADAIRTAYETNFGLAPKDLDGETVWCWAEDCADGARLDPEYRARENPFGGNLGQRQPMVIGDDLLMASADRELVLAHLGAAAGTLPDLADDPGYLAAVNAVSKDADVVQAMLANPAASQRMAEEPLIDNRLPPEIRSAAQETLLDDFQELPPFDLLILADAVTEDEQIARLGIVYKDADSAELAAAILLDRLESHYSIQRQLAFSEMLAERNVADPRYYVHSDGGRAVLVLEFSAPKATPDEIISMLDFLHYQGSATPPGLIYRLFQDLFASDDTSWLSTVTRAELEATQVGTIAIDAPANSSVMLVEGAGDEYTYYALEGSSPQDWEDVSGGTLWICSEDERPPLIPAGIVNSIDGGGFPAGTRLTLVWSDQPGTPDSSELGINEIIATVGVTYEGCIKAALEAMEDKPTLLLTETNSMFDSKDRLVVVEFY